MQKSECEVVKPDVNPSWLNKEINVDTSLNQMFTKQDPPDLIKSLALEAMQTYSSSLAMFTDGSKDTQGRVGSAVYIPEINYKYSGRIGDNLSVYTSELIAILHCINWIIDNDSNVMSNSRNVVIYSDSLSSIESLQTGKSNSRPNLIKYIIARLNAIESRNVVIMWIPSHVGISGNEQADRLAKQALGLDYFSINVMFEALELNEQIDVFVANLWQAESTNTRLDDSTKC